MVVMPACGESLCKNCFRNHFKITIKERSVKHFNCPICAVPDLSNPDETLDMNLQLFVAMVTSGKQKETASLIFIMLIGQRTFAKKL